MSSNYSQDEKGFRELLRDLFDKLEKNGFIEPHPASQKSINPDGDGAGY